MDLSVLDHLDPPHLHVLVGEPSDPWQHLTYPLHHTGKVVREVRATKMHTLDELYTEFAAALQFPSYFGENWPAFHECMTELDHLGDDTPGYVIVIRTAEELLTDEHPDTHANLLQLLGSIAESWATPVTDGEWWDRPGRPFHVVLQVLPERSDELLQRLRALDVQVGQL